MKIHHDSNVQLRERFPDSEIVLQGDDKPCMVSVLLDGEVVWRVDTNDSPILASRTTESAVTAVMNAYARAEQVSTESKKPLPDS